MFSLIISIIGIALVSALALASIYYGGKAFSKYQVEIDASTIVNQGLQIHSAVQTQIVNKDTSVRFFSELVPGYLTSMPIYKNWNWNAIDLTVDKHAFIFVEDEAVCDEINRRAGHSQKPNVNEFLKMYGCDINWMVYYNTGSLYTN